MLSLMPWERCWFSGYNRIKQDQERQNMGKRLYVSNISNRATEESIRVLFATCGEVESLNLITDARTKKPKGMAFLVMTTAEEAQQAIAVLSGTLLNGRPLSVSEANTQEPRERRDLDTESGRKNRR